MTPLVALQKAEQRINQQASNPVRSAFATRAINAIVALIGQTEPKMLIEITSASSDIEVLIRALVNHGESEAARVQSPLLASRLRGITMREKLFQAAGGLLPVSRVATILGISRQAVDKRRKADQLLAVSVGKRGYLYPACQFEDEKIIEGVAKILPKMKTLSSWSALRFLVNVNDRLEGRTPIQALHQGEIERVAGAASQFLEHGAA
jgi:hypothetical protein